MKLRSKSFAKLNLCLHVIGIREDSFHDIESIFQTIDLYDEIDFTLRNDRSFNLKCDSVEIDNDQNLITRAYQFMKNKYPDIHYGMDINLRKNIPLFSGLGGGSSNAAITILAINHLYKLGLSKVKLTEAAEQIGSDVPFFIHGGTAFVTGKGEQIMKIDYNKRFYILIFPDLYISTSEAYSLLPKTSFIDSRGVDELSKSSFNSFEEIVMTKFPQLGDTKYWLSSFGRVRMSGTGSTLFIEFDNYDDASEAYKEIGRKYKSKIVSSLESYDIFS